MKTQVANKSHTQRLFPACKRTGRGECQEGGEDLKINGLLSVANGGVERERERERERESVILCSFIFFKIIKKRSVEWIRE